MFAATTRPCFARLLVILVGQLDAFGAGEFSRQKSPCRTVLAPAGAVGVLRTPVVNHGHNVTKWAPTVLALVWAAFTPIVRDMFPATWTVGMLWTPTVQQRTQRSVFRAAIDAHVLAALSTLVQSVFTLAGSAWMLRTPAVQQRPRIAGRRSTVLAVFAHVIFLL